MEIEIKEQDEKLMIGDIVTSKRGVCIVIGVKNLGVDVVELATGWTLLACARDRLTKVRSAKLTVEVG